MDAARTRLVNASQFAGVSENALFYRFMKKCRESLTKLLTPSAENKLLNRVLIFVLESQPTKNKETTILMHTCEEIINILHPNAIVIVVPATWKGEYIAKQGIQLDREYKDVHYANKILTIKFMKQFLKTEIARYKVGAEQGNIFAKIMHARYVQFELELAIVKKKDDKCDGWGQFLALVSKLQEVNKWQELFDSCAAFHKLLNGNAVEQPIEVVSIDFGTSNLGWWRGQVDSTGTTYAQELKVIDLTADDPLVAAPIILPAINGKKRKVQQVASTSKPLKARKKKKKSSQKITCAFPNVSLLRARLNNQV